MQVPNYFEFFSQSKIISGNRALEHIPFELISLDVVRPMVITNRRAVKDRLTGKLIKAFYDSNITIGALFDEVPGYASISLIRELAGLFRDRGCDSLISLGGGSVTDVTKGLNILISERTDDLFNYAGEDNIPDPLKPMVFIATSTFTGTEVAGVTEIDSRSFSSDFLYPDLTVLDPRMVRGCCPQCSAETILIAIAQSFEASAFSSDNPITDTYTQAALQFLFENYKKGYKKPGKKKVDLAIANAASMASIAFSNAPVGITHLLASELSKETGISFGKCVGVLFPACLQYMKDKKSNMREDILLSMAGMDVYAKTPDNKKIPAVMDMIKKLYKVMKKSIPSSLKELRIPGYKLEGIAVRAAGQSGKRFSKKDCLAVLEMAYAGSPIK